MRRQYQVLDGIRSIVPLRWRELIAALHDHSQHQHLLAVPEGRGPRQKCEQDHSTSPAGKKTTQGDLNSLGSNPVHKNILQDRPIQIKRLKMSLRWGQLKSTTSAIHVISLVRHIKNQKLVQNNNNNSNSQVNLLPISRVGLIHGTFQYFGCKVTRCPTELWLEK